MPETPKTTGDDAHADSPRRSLYTDLLVLAGGIVLTGLVGFLWAAQPVVLLAFFLVMLVTLFSCCYRRWVVALAYVVLTVVWFLPAKSACREAARRPTGINNLKQIGLALHNYHDCSGCFPPPYVADAEGKPLYSWRLLLLPYLEENPLYERWHLDEPWDSPHNRPLAEQAIGVFRCPSAKFGRHVPLTS
ncbi:MAG: DUF1559 domain-containing protein [Patescibacteria group bacterium]|nr:DUF1559 domain-containing protein [Patescibacteria group bacterium]